ncbi:MULTISPECIES: ribosome biogenesis GTP-binding protein YihA/YsxC [Caproicibacterium]|uniref:Probable GTP-binding protein EngB n=1 Tax=Caproicibacterium argilliputei TaxID=3030016 RepID=A0AA97D8I6_9FIRM|nr:ribosome biogenesis GTP-binding protein YihA/YsxC [Caproicibacterium argilliputei]WOC31015.1 ribosome biogenesis GTP-binding protein YihA/YsxC [Caproicibacterium argilliputei]
MKIESAAFEMSAGTSQQLPKADVPEIVFSGKSNVGKSSLINKLLNRKSLARVSSQPGKTATINFYRMDICRLVDLPGYGYAKVSHAEKLRWAELVDGYFHAGRPVALLIQILDMRHDPTEDDRQMIHFLLESGFPFLIAATKSDKLNVTQRKERLAALQQLFTGTNIEVVPFSALKGENVEVLRARIDAACRDTAE